MGYKLMYSHQAKKDGKMLEKSNFDLKTKALLAILKRNPCQNPPPYEKLVGNMSGAYSRRINLQHRLVYQVAENTESLRNENNHLYEGIVRILRMWTHYE